MRKHKTCYTVDSETCTAGRFVRRNRPDFRVLHLPCSAHFSIRIPVVQSKECENGSSSDALLLRNRRSSISSLLPQSSPLDLSDLRPLSSSTAKEGLFVW